MKTIFVKRNKQIKGLSLAQSGQATLEMVLVLMIGVIVTLGLVYRFNTAFKKYTTDMFGSYYRCLLETGELPGVGLCQDRQMRFDIANGRELVRGNAAGGSGAGGGGGGSSGSSGGKGSGGKGSSNKQASNGSGSSDSGGGGGGGGSESVGSSNQSSGGGTGSVIGRLRTLGKTRSTAVGTRANLSKEDGGAGRGDPLAVGSKSGSAESLKRARTKMSFKMDGDEYQRAETAAVSSVSASAVKKTVDKDGNSLRPRTAVEKTDRKVAGQLDKDKGGGMDFGRIFKLFLIFAIIVAIIIFLGGQVLQISKSGEQ